MKRIAFVTRRKILGQGIAAALSLRPELKLELLPLIPPQNVRMDVCVYEPELLLIDVEGGADGEEVRAICRDVRRQQPGCALMLLFAEDKPCCRALSVQARQEGLADDFLFYENSIDYLLAKLAAL